MARIILKSKICFIEFCYDQDGLRKIRAIKQINHYPGNPQEIPDWLKKCMLQMNEYMLGNIECFKSVPLHWGEVTNIQKQILIIIKKIPYGKTTFYKNIAEKYGEPHSARMVGQVCRVNPFPILIPCHRVIQKSGGIGGYSQGVNIKRQLLKLEGFSDND